MTGAAHSPHLGHYDALAATCRRPLRTQTMDCQFINKTAREGGLRLIVSDASAYESYGHSLYESAELSGGS